MYLPNFRHQLTGIATQHVDCGTRVTQMGLDWLTKGALRMSIAKIREAMDDQDQTNYQQWDALIDTLGGLTYGFRGVKTNRFADVRDHLAAQGAVMWTSDYAKERKLMQGKCGSLTFGGYHAELLAGLRQRDGSNETLKLDPLNDGRYKGCPNGKVWVPLWKARESGFSVGQKEAGQDKVYAVLLFRDTTVAPVEPGDLLPESGMSLSDIYAETVEIVAEMPDCPQKAELDTLADDLATIIGITANPEADETTPVESGIIV